MLNRGCGRAHRMRQWHIWLVLLFTISTLFPVIVGRTGMLGILVGMDQKVRFAFSCCSHVHCVQRQVCNDRCATTGAMGYGVQETAVFPQLLFMQVVDFSLVVQRPNSMVLVTMEIPQLRVDTVVDAHFLQSCSSLSCHPRLVPMVQTVLRTIARGHGGRCACHACRAGFGPSWSFTSLSRRRG